VIPEIDQIKNNFRENVDKVHRLVNFDDVIQRLYVDGLKRAERGLRTLGAEKHPSFRVENYIASIENIRKHESVRTHYEVMLNQCVVLLVSYLASAVEDIFEFSLTEKIKSGRLGKLATEELRISLGELQQYDFNVLDNVGRMIISRKDISFQDMQSIARAFNDYLGYEPEKDKDVNNIIVSQACRNSIVHSGGVISDKTARQISTAEPRDIKKDLEAAQTVQFKSDEIEVISASMICYVDKLSEGLNGCLPTM
jgi:hypothetical protein